MHIFKLVSSPLSSPYDWGGVHSRLGGAAESSATEVGQRGKSCMGIVLE